MPKARAPLDMGGSKITSLANGSASAEAAAYGQTPAGGATATIPQGGTGQTSAAAAYNALSPMTTKGDMEYDSAAGTAARLAVGSAGQVLGVSAGVPAWGMGLTLLASTGTGGYALVNGTGNIISYTFPGDGLLHRVMVFTALYVSVAETGGTILLSYTVPSGNSASNTVTAGSVGTGAKALNDPVVVLVQAGSTVTLSQSTALNPGTATLWAELWGS